MPGGTSTSLLKSPDARCLPKECRSPLPQGQADNKTQATQRSKVAEALQGQELAPFGALWQSSLSSVILSRG